MHSPECRFCQTPLTHVLCNLGMSPLSNSYVKFENVHLGEKFYPLKVWVCDKCLLAQLESFESPDAIFSDYLYFSSFSTSWVEHARNYCEMMTERFGFGGESQVIEIASNDGYLLQHFKAKGIPVLGVEPAANVAKVAWDEKGIPSVVKFFGVETAKELVATGKSADLLLGNNVMAHVPDINDFIGGLKIALKPEGVITFEFPHLQRLIEGNQFDTVYHEHFSYLSFLAVDKMFSHHGLTLFDVEELPTHGGSLRIFARHTENPAEITAVTDRVEAMRKQETDFGLTDMDTYTSFGEKVKATKRKLLKFLIDCKESGKSVVGYGAAAKGVTLVNYCGVRDDLVDYVVDKSPYKQNHFMPGVRIPIYGPEKIFETKPDYVLILPWNLRKEISGEMAKIREWGGKFVVPIPEVTVLD
jgi:SAM-dependent methyltransferase